jgi:RNA polymerase sigma factor (sigma-70 family)
MTKTRHQRSMTEDLQSLFQLGAMGAWDDGKLVAHFASEQAGCEGAFRVLLNRHGPMVLAVCRRVLGDSHAAEDAFQATFLILVRKAGSVRDHNVLAGWLCGVATRVARKARAQAAHRRTVELRAAERSGQAEAHRDPGQGPEGAEVRTLIHEEIAQLPLRYREPLVLCYLEGLRHQEIAERLDCPVGTVESRLSRGRERLRSRLERRGLAPTASAPAMLALARDVPAAVPASLIEATIRCASGLGSRKLFAEAASATVTALAGTTSWPHLGSVLPGLVACVGIFAAGLGVYGSRDVDARPEPPAAVAAAVDAPATPPPPTPTTAPVPEPPHPSPSRPDSAVARPLTGITIDGRLDDWPTDLERHPIRRRLLGVSAYDQTAAGPRADFRVGYNREAGQIYLAVEVEDEDVVVSPADHLHTDAVEVYVEGLFSDRSISDWPHDASKLPVVQYAGVPGPVAAYGDPKGKNPSLLYGKIAHSSTTMAYHRAGNVTTYEWAVQAFDRYPDLPTHLEPGKRVGLEVVVLDKDRDRPKPTWLNWGPTWAGFKGQDASSLGELILVDGP